LEISQTKLADRIGTDQVTLSRWERGEFAPSYKYRRTIEQLAQEAGLASLNDIVGLVTHSPFPMILVSRELIVVAASQSSGFSEGFGTAEQTPDDERDFFAKFRLDVEASGFWDLKTSKLDYAFEIEGLTRKAIMVPVVVHGEVYALVQKA
jgi:transcriptional regulator with XRE-family HTH domain